MSHPHKKSKLDRSSQVYPLPQIHVKKLSHGIYHTNKWRPSHMVSTVAYFALVNVHSVEKNRQRPSAELLGVSKIESLLGHLCTWSWAIWRLIIWTILSLWMSVSHEGDNVYVLMLNNRATKYTWNEHEHFRKRWFVETYQPNDIITTNKLVDRRKLQLFFASYTYHGMLKNSLTKLIRKRE